MAEYVGARALRRVLVVLVATFVVVVAYWVFWFVDRSAVASNDRPAYFEFENAFPFADGWLAVSLAAGAVALLRRRPIALLLLVAGSGAGVYLFCLDVLYDLEHGIWWRSGAGGVIELAINVVTLAVSVGLLWWSWRHRSALLNGEPEPAPTDPRG
jgi:hypothetical protein